MGIMGMFKWFRKDIIQRDRNRRTLPPHFDGLNNEAYKKAIHTFIERRNSCSDSTLIVAPSSPDKILLDLPIKRNCKNQRSKDNNKINRKESNEVLPGIRHVSAPDILEIDCVAGTEDRYLELVYAEWHNTKVSLRRHTHPECKNAIKTDLEILTDIRHPNVLFLMGTTQTEEHGLIAIFEPVDCTLFNYIHEQGEHISVQGVAKWAGNLAAALKHAHMHGYVHSAISSHCVYLASTGAIKLGGWELASNINTPKIFREYEDRLRTEVFKWQAPELLTGHEAAEASDVYGLALLMWEMCTMNIPWNNLTKTEVEKQYTHYRKGIIIDLYNFPPLLNNLLKTSLQLDVTKRTFDVIKMSKYLQRLEMQYEDDEPLYIEYLKNDDKSATTPTCKSPVVIKCSETPRRQIVRVHQAYQTCENIQDDRTQTEDLLEEVLERPRLKNVNVIAPKYSKTNGSSKPAVNRETSSRRFRSNESTDEKAYSDPRVNIKKLKELLANKRKTFFYGNESRLDKCESLKAKLMTQIRSKDYEPHKPASHKTSIEPKVNKSPEPYGAYTRCSHVRMERPYSGVPTTVRDAIIQPQVLNPDLNSFFETSLWQKEKEICISKMRKDKPDECQSVNTMDGNRGADDSETYTFNGEKVNQTTLTIDLSRKGTGTIARSKSLQALRDALDRATNIIQSTSDDDDVFNSSTIATAPDSSECSSFGSCESSVQDERESSEANESIFEELYGLNEHANEDIKGIDCSSKNISIFKTKRNSDDNKKSILNEASNKSEDNEKHRGEAANPVNLDETTKSVTRTNFRSESIAKRFTEDYSAFEQSKGPKVLCHESTAKDMRNGNGPLFLSRSNDKSKLNVDKQTNSPLLFKNKVKETSCFLSTEEDSIRRRSLPAYLEQSRSLNNTPLDKMSIRKMDLPNTTVEDIYIDDEFNESLGVNLVLMNVDDSADLDNSSVYDFMQFSDFEDCL